MFTPRNGNVLRAGSTPDEQQLGALACFRRWPGLAVEFRACLPDWRNSTSRDATDNVKHRPAAAGPLSTATKRNITERLQTAQCPPAADRLALRLPMTPLLLATCYWLPLTDRQHLPPYCGRLLLAWPPAHCWPPTTCPLLLAASLWPPTTCSLLLGAAYHWPPTARRLGLAACYWLPPTGSLLRPGFHWPPMPGHILLTIWIWLPNTRRLILTACHSPTTTNLTAYDWPATGRGLLAAYSKLPATGCLSLAACRVPTTAHRMHCKSEPRRGATSSSNRPGICDSVRSKQTPISNIRPTGNSKSLHPHSRAQIEAYGSKPGGMLRGPGGAGRPAKDRRGVSTTAPGCGAAMPTGNAKDLGDLGVPGAAAGTMAAARVSGNDGAERTGANNVPTCCGPREQPPHTSAGAGARARGPPLTSAPSEGPIRLWQRTPAIACVFVHGSRPRGGQLEARRPPAIHRIHHH